MGAGHRTVCVLIASGDAMVRELLSRALNRRPRFRVAAIATTVQEVVDAAGSGKLHVALISASLGDGALSGFTALRQLRESVPELKSVLMLDDPQPAMIVDAFRAGARGVFCPSRSAFSALCRCVDCIDAGQIWANSTELQYVLDAFAQFAPMRMVDAGGLRLLTNREEEVVRLLAEGMHNREIARELDISEHTVKNYLFRIFDKLGISSRVELILYAVSSVRMQAPALVERSAGGSCQQVTASKRSSNEPCEGSACAKLSEPAEVRVPKLMS